MTRFPLIDSHHHIWGGDEDKGMNPPAYTCADYLADMAPFDLGASVFVQCFTHYDRALPPAMQSLGETRFAAGLGERPGTEARIARAIVGFVDLLGDGDLAGLVSAHVAAGKGKLRGVRRIVAWDEDESLNAPLLETAPAMLADPALVAGLHVLRDHDLHFETWLWHPQLPELAAFAAQVRETTIVLNHGGAPLIAGRHVDPARVEADWREGIARVAEQPNVLVKIGGLISHHSLLDAERQRRGLDDWTAPTLAEALAPWLEWMVACFGAERCLFETNFPVDRTHCSASVLVEAYVRALAHLPEPAQAAIFAQNAARLYRLAP